MASAATNNGADNGAFVDLEEALKIMKLTSDGERALFEKVMAWWKTRPARLSIQIEPAVGAALFTRILLANARVPLENESNSTLASPTESSKPSLVSPEDDAEEDDGKDDSAIEIKSSRQGLRRRAKKIKDDDMKHQDSDKTIKKPELRNEFLLSLASDLAALLSALSISDKTSLPTVAYITSAYYFMFKGKSDDSDPTEIATEMVEAVIDENASNEDIIQYSALLQKTLLSLSRAGKSSVEAFADFEYLWASCCTYPIFRSLIEKVQDEYGTTDVAKNDNGKRTIDDSTQDEGRFEAVKVLCWKLACLAEEERKEEQFGYVTGRRGRIFRAAACLGLVASLPDVSSSVADDEEQEMEDTAANNDEVKDDDSSHASRASKKSRRSEEGAVEVLSKKVQGRKSPSLELDSSKARNAKTPMTIVQAAVNELLTSLKPSFHSDVAALPELQYTVLHNIKQFIKSGLLPTTLDENHEWPSSRDFVEEDKDKDTSEDFNASFLTKLTLYLGTKTERVRLVDSDAIDTAMSESLKHVANHFDKMSRQDVSFIGFPFVDEVKLASRKLNIIPFLCMASMKASSDGIALISQYEAGSVVGPDDESKTLKQMSFIMPLAAAPTRAMRETMDLNEWTASVLSVTDVRPKTKLTLYLEASDDESVKKKRKRPDGVVEEIVTGGGWRTVVIPLLNRVLARLIDDTPKPGATDGEHKPRVHVREKDGALEVNGDEDDAEVKLCKALISLYYQALEALFYHETARLMSASHPKLIMSELFHRAALTCCCVCLMKGLCSSSALAISDKFLDLDFPCIQRIMESCPYTYLKVSESFARALKLYKLSGQGQQSFHVLGLPRILQRQLSQCDVLVIDSLLWSREPNYSLGLSVMDIIENIKSMPTEGLTPQWPPDVLAPTLPEEIADAHLNRVDKGDSHIPPPPDHLFLSYIIRKLLKVAFFRISALCSQLSIPPEYPIASQVWIAFRYLLRHEIELLYDRHVDQLILCTLYGVCKIMKMEPEPTFTKIIEVYAVVRGPEMGERACHRLVRHIKLGPNKQYGNIIQFYNTLFVPALKNHLLQSKSLKQAVRKLEEYMADPDKTDARLFAKKDSEAMADRADKLANGSGSWANEPKSVPLKRGNVKMNVLLPTALNTDPAVIKKSKKGKVSEPSSENRTFFSFGGVSAQNMKSLNQMAETKD